MKKGTQLLTENILWSLEVHWNTSHQTIGIDTRNCHLLISQNFSQELRNLSKKNPTNPTCAYPNINSIKNKSNDLQELIKDSIDVVMIAKTITDASYPTTWFLIENYHQSFKLDIINKSGSIVYVKSSVPSWHLKCDTLKTCSGYSIWFEFEKREMACDINI